MLRCLDLKAAAVARPLLDAATAIATKGAVPAADDFLRAHSKWRRQLRAKGDDDARLREVAVMFHLRDALRSGDIRSEEHTSELQSLMRISYAVVCLKKKNTNKNTLNNTITYINDNYIQT